MRKAVKVDFDGTLFTEAYPNIGEPKNNVINLVKLFKKIGIVVILDTCREGKLLDDAVSECAKYGLRFDFVNENDPERIAFFGGDCRKISADWTLDDRAISLFDAEKIAGMLGGLEIANALLY